RALPAREAHRVPGLRRPADMGRAAGRGSTGSPRRAGGAWRRAAPRARGRLPERGRARARARGVAPERAPGRPGGRVKPGATRAAWSALLLAAFTDALLIPFYPQFFERTFGSSSLVTPGIYVALCRLA